MSYYHPCPAESLTAEASVKLTGVIACSSLEIVKVFDLQTSHLGLHMR